MIKDKKGQVGGAMTSVLTLIIGISVSVLVLIFVGTLGGQTFQLTQDDIAEIGNNVVTGEVLTLYNCSTSTTYFAHNFVQPTTIAVYNATTSFGNANFTIDTTESTICLKDVAPLVTRNNTAYSVNYTWGSADVRASIQGASVSGFDALEQTGNYLPIIVLAVVIALVLALVLSFTGMTGGTMGGSAL